LKSAIVKQTRHTQQRKLLELYDYHACAGAERAALGAKADQVVRISAKPIAMGSTSRDWLIYWRHPAVGARRGARTEVYFLTQIDFSRF